MLVHDHASRGRQSKPMGKETSELREEGGTQVFPGQAGSRRLKEASRLAPRSLWKLVSKNSAQHKYSGHHSMC